MNLYRFVGTINPPSLLDVNNIEVVLDDIKGFDQPISGRLEISADKDNVTVTFNTNNNFDDDLETLKNSLEYLCNSFINSYNYFFATAVDVYLTMGGNIKVQMYTFPPQVLNIQRKFKERPIEPLELSKIVLSNPSVARILEELKSAIKHPFDRGFHCYRAIEAIRQTFIPALKKDSGNTRSLSWDSIRKSLRFDISFIEIIKNNAGITRHGAVVSLDGKTSIEILEKTWKIVDRFLIFVIENNKPLGDDFDILK